MTGTTAVEIITVAMVVYVVVMAIRTWRERVPMVYDRRHHCWRSQRQVDRRCRNGYPLCHVERTAGGLIQPHGLATPSASVDA